MGSAKGVWQCCAPKASDLMMLFQTVSPGSRALGKKEGDGSTGYAERARRIPSALSEWAGQVFFLAARLEGPRGEWG